MGQEPRILFGKFFTKGLSQGAGWGMFSFRGLTREKSASKLI